MFSYSTKMTFTFLLLLLSVSCSSVSEPQPQKTATKTYTVKKVSDGDTFWIYNGTEKGEKIRLIGVDAPETQKSRKKEIGYYGEEAKAYLKQLLNSKNVRIEYDVSSKDQYGRTLAYVYLEDGTFVNAALVKNGYATVLTIPPNVKHAKEFVKLQQEARENKRGLWGEIK